ncbi:MAG: methanol oxidation system protein MoxJ [Candidatus Methylopumilus sp.]
MCLKISNVLPRFKKSLKQSVLSGMLMLVASGAGAADLNVCAGKDELPFSSQNQEGFENEIAKVIAGAMGRNINFVWWPDARYVVRDFLDTKKCDVMLGVDESDPRVLKTGSYYKSGYVFISRADRNIDISSWDDPILKERNFRIGVLPDSPGKNLLLQINRYDDMFDYFAELTNYESTRNKYIRISPKKLIDDVESKHLHAAMLWGPEAGRYVRDAKIPLRMQLIDDTVKKPNGQKLPMHYQVFMGVRKDDAALKQQLDDAIKSKQKEIEAILKKEGIPLL